MPGASKAWQRLVRMGGRRKELAFVKHVVGFVGRTQMVNRRAEDLVHGVSFRVLLADAWKMDTTVFPAAVRAAPTKKALQTSAV